MEISELYKIFLQHPTITTDTRECTQDSIFFALKGETFNGNLFAMQALEKGCCYAVVDELTDETRHEKRVILVDDVLSTLQQLAHHHRTHLATKIIGVTGTNGKTTTKELIATVLSKRYRVLYTQGNFNNHIGVPKTLLRLTSEHDIAVIEMGANHPGEIKTLVEIVEPDYGIITNVGRAHLGGFGSFEGVMKTKGELYDFLRPRHSKIFLDKDNEYLCTMAHGLKHVCYGTKQDPENLVVGECAECAPYLTFRWHQRGCGEHTVSTRLIGDYNIHNMLAAIAIGLTFGIREKDICQALEDYTPSNNRSQLTMTESNKLVVDAYNANPTSMAAALRNFQAIKMQHKMLILGSMAELGDVTAEEHKKIIDIIDTMDVEKVWLIGEGFATQQHRYRQFAGIEEVRDAILSEKPENMFILIKGSNSQRLFTLPEIL